jgi:hypothetical protein
MGVLHFHHLARLYRLSARRQLDGFVIDCDDVSGGTDLLTEIRGSGSNKASVVVAVVNGTTSVNTAVDAGANFVLGKRFRKSNCETFST